jgi:hypothetical protein
MGYNSKDADKLLTNERKLKKGEAPQKILLRSSTTESEETTRGWRIEDKALDAVKGSLKCRLDTDFHFPVPQATKNAPCGLCCWALKDEISRDKCRVRGAHVANCDKCNVSLCLSCFKPFHTISDITELRSDVKKTVTHLNVISVVIIKLFIMYYLLFHCYCCYSW